MRKYIKWGAISLILFVICFAYAHIYKMHPVFDTDVDAGLYIGTPVGEEAEYSQTFTCEEQFLDGVALKFGTGEELDKVSVVYSISDQSGREVGSGVLPGKKLANNKYNKMKVERIENAKGETYTFRCHVENDDEANGISIYQEGEHLVMKYFAFRFDFETLVIACSFCVYVIVFMKILFKLFRE